MHIAICLIIPGAHMNVLFILKVWILVLMKWSCLVPQLCWLLSLEWLAYSEHLAQSLLSICS